MVRRVAWWMLALVAVGVPAAEADQQTPEPRVIPTVETATHMMGECPDPPDLLADGSALSSPEERTAALVAYRERSPELYGPTSPPEGSVRLPAPFEPAGALVLAYPALDDYDGWFGALVADAAQQGQVVILHRPDTAARLDELLAAAGAPPDAVTRIADVPFESVWMRDYGPIAVETAAGPALVDPRYYLDCVQGDAVPTRLAAHLGGLPVVRPPLWLEGGDLMSNGAGLCFSTTHTARRNGLTEEQYEQYLADYFGCQRSVLLSPMVGHAAEHVDLFLAVAAEDHVLLAGFDAAEDPVNAAVMELNRARLAGTTTLDGRPLRVGEVPMPPPGLPDPASGEPVIRSYLNLVVFNGAVYVPVYPGHRGREGPALETIAGAFPGKRIVPVAAGSLARDEGALHCISTTLPVTAAGGG